MQTVFTKIISFEENIGYPQLVHPIWKDIYGGVLYHMRLQASAVLEQGIFEWLAKIVA